MSNTPPVGQIQVKSTSTVMSEVQVRQFLLTIIPVLATLGFVKTSGYVQDLLPFAGIITQGIVIVWGWLASRKVSVHAVELANKVDDSIAVVVKK